MQQTNLNIGTIGQRLEAARQAKGVSVSEAGRATKILSKFIEAMESDDFGALSAPVYAKSFIKMYAQYLGLDAQPLVDEYVVQHAPRARNHLSDEARQKLAKADQVPTNGNGESHSAPSPKSNGKPVFGGVDQAIAQLSVPNISPKLLMSVAGGVVLLLVIVLSATQCADDEAEAPAAGGAASVERARISDGIPDTYLVGPGEVELEKQGQQ